MSAQDELPYDPRPPAPGSRWVLTLFAQTLDNAALEPLMAAAAQDGLHMTGQRTLAATPAVQEFSWVGDPPGPLRGRLRAAMNDARHARIDAVLQPDRPDRRDKRLLVMDVDSTLIRQEVIDEIARAAGAYDEVAAITERAMNGELSFEASLKARVGALKGVPATVFSDVLHRIEVTEGATVLIRGIQAGGGKVAMISGGFLQVVEPLRARLGIDFAFANTLAVRDGHLTGAVEGPIVDRARKAILLEGLARDHDLTLEQVVAVGDGANDLDMLARAGLGIAFNAKPSVQTQAPTCLNQPSLAAVLHLLGHDEAEIDRLSLAR